MPGLDRARSFILANRNEIVKPKIWHLIEDKRVGGSNLLVKNLITSRLSEQFNFSMLKLEEVQEKLKIQKPDVIVFHYPCAWKYLFDLFWLKRHCKVFIYDHHYCQGFEREQVTSPVRFRLMLRLAYGLANGLLIGSQAQRDWLLSHKLVNAKKVKVISPASPIEAMLKIAPRDLEVPLVLGAYGRFARQKGFDLLLKAIALLPSEKFQLHLGGYGQDEAMIRELTKKLPNVKLVGIINNVPAFLASCDVIVIPSRWEPWGLVCLEAKAAGKPVVVTEVDGLCEQVQSSWGVLVPPNDEKKLAEAIASLPKQNLPAWRKAARSSVLKAWDEFLNGWEAFFVDVILERNINLGQKIVKQTPKTKVIYIASQERSGSTLISQILGQIHGFISVGELYIIWRYGLMENRLCGCNVSFKNCQFWQEVLEKANLGQVDPQEMFQLSRKLVRYFPLAFLPRGRKFLMSRLGAYPTTVEKLYGKIPTITGSRVIVDASKSLVHYYLLSQLPNLDVYVVHLVRDPRGVEFSLLKRKLQGVPEFLHHSLVKGSLAWTGKNILMEWLGKKAPQRYLRIRYEDFVRQPDINLRKICNLVGEDVASLPLIENNQFVVTSNHVIAGSPQRFRSGVDRLKLDEAWKEKMTANERKKVTLLTLPLLSRYGYNMN